MTKEINQKILDKVTKGLLSLKTVKYKKKPKPPTKKDLNKKFVMNEVNLWCVKLK